MWIKFYLLTIQLHILHRNYVRFSFIIATIFECDPTVSGGIITCWVLNHKRLLSECNISKFRSNSSDEAEYAEKGREETATTGLIMNLSSCIQQGK